MKLSEMINKDMHAAHHERMRRVFFIPLKAKLTDVCVAKLVEHGDMSEETAREFFASSIGDMFLHTIMGNAVELLHKFDTERREKEMTIIRNSEWTCEKLAEFLQPKQNTICPCGITRSDCTYHK